VWQNTNEYRLARKYDKRKKRDKSERKRSLKLRGRGGKTIVLDQKYRPLAFYRTLLATQHSSSSSPVMKKTMESNTGATGE
jgi:hypothetical protein